MEYLELLVAHHPSHLSGLCQLATAHMQLGHRAQAKEMFQKVLTVDPHNSMTLQNYGERKKERKEGGGGEGG